MASQQTEPKRKEEERTSAPSLLDKIVAQQAEVAARYRPVMSIEDSIERYKQLKWYFENVMLAGVDYVTIPGSDKPFLSKSGAQGLCAFFGYVPRYEMMSEIEDWTGADHNGEALFYYKFRCVLERDHAGVGEGIGSANSWEAKFRFRVSERQCPDCGAETIIKGKPEFGGGWICYKKKGGCGAKFSAEDERIVEQETGRKANDQFPDVINTCQKQAEKRAYVEATLSATSASRFFSQDEDAVVEMPDFAKPKQQAQPEPEARKQPNGKPQSRPVPKELSKVFSNVDRDVTAAIDAYSRLEGMFIQKAGDAGFAEYNRIADLFNAKYPQGTSDKAAHKDFLLNLWDALQAVKPPAEPVQETKGK